MFFDINIANLTPKMSIIISNLKSLAFALFNLTFWRPDTGGAGGELQDPLHSAGEHRVSVFTHTRGGPHDQVRVSCCVSFVRLLFVSERVHFFCGSFVIKLFL